MQFQISKSPSPSPHSWSRLRRLTTVPTDPHQHSIHTSTHLPTCIYTSIHQRNNVAQYIISPIQNHQLSQTKSSSHLHPSIHKSRQAIPANHDTPSQDNAVDKGNNPNAQNTLHTLHVPFSTTMMLMMMSALSLINV
jgi:hypothetical protein